MNRNFTSDEIIKLIDTLIGPIEAVGETNADNKIYNNLLLLTEVIDWYIYKIYDSSKTAQRPEASMSKIGNEALAALREWRDFLYENVD